MRLNDGNVQYGGLLVCWVIGTSKALNAKFEGVQWGCSFGWSTDTRWIDYKVESSRCRDADDDGSGTGLDAEYHRNPERTIGWVGLYVFYYPRPNIGQRILSLSDLWAPSGIRPCAPPVIALILLLKDDLRYSIFTQNHINSLWLSNVLKPHKFRPTIHWLR